MSDVADDPYSIPAALLWEVSEPIWRRALCVIANLDQDFADCTWRMLLIEQRIAVTLAMRKLAGERNNASPG